SGTVGPNAPQADWTAPSPPGGVASTSGPDNCADPGAFCDSFLLTVDVTPAYWDDHSGGVDVSITWTNPVNDFDLYVYQGGEKVTEGATSPPGTQEAASIPAASGEYELRVVYFTVAGEGYAGNATFVSKDGRGGATFDPTPLGFG